MSPKAQNRAIAAALGWDGFEDSISPEFPDIGVEPQNEVTERLLGPRNITNWTPRFPIPDYTKNLNACAKFERAIAGEGREDEYLQRLSEEARGDGGVCFKVSEADHWACATATAAQRSKAFLRTMDLWMESPKGE